MNSSTTYRSRRVAGILTAAVIAAAASLAAVPADAAGSNPAQTVDTSLTPTQLAQSLVGPGVEVSNVAYSGGSASSGSFAFTDPTVVGFNSGVLLSSGGAADVVGPNTQDDLSGALYLSGDADLSALAGFETFDAAVLEFDFVPTANQVTFQYSFASEEYPEYVGSPFNDVFAFFVNGTNCATVREVAGDPTSQFVPVAINRINDGNPANQWAPQRPDLFRPNYFNPAGPSLIDLEADGITQTLTCQSAVSPGTTNHMKLAIADASDYILDSTVFIQAGSLVSNENPVADLSLSEEEGSAPFTVTAYVEGEDPNPTGQPLTYYLDWGDGTAPATGSLPDETAQVTHTYTVGGHYTATLTVSNGTLSGVSHEDVTVFGSSGQGPQVTASPHDQVVHDGDLVTFAASASGVPEPDVQWQRSTDGGATFDDVPDATDTAYTFTAVLSMDGDQYRAVFSNSEGEATTQAAVLTVGPAAEAPTVTSSPVDQTVVEGAEFTFSAAADGVPAPDVQWQVSTDGGSVFADVEGATEATYSGTASLADDGHQYRAVFTNEAGIATTDAATLSVNPLDTTGPVVDPTFSSPPPFLRHATGITASANASDPESGIVSQSCGVVVTSSIGDKVLTCSATNGAGLTTSVVVHYPVGFGLAAASPSDNSTVKRAKSLTVSFRLIDANGVIPASEASSIRSGIRVAWDGGTAVTPSWTKKTNTFKATLAINRPPSGSTHLIGIVVQVGTFTALSTQIHVTIG